MTIDQVIAECTIEGNVVKLPVIQLERKVYMETAKRLEGIGGKWNRKLGGFLFKGDPSALLGRVQSGEKVNLKKDFQYFPTPEGLAKRLVDMAFIDWHHRVLEPSAGQGAIVKAIVEQEPQISVDCFELMEENAVELAKVTGARIIGSNFLESIPAITCGIYDRIIANPPFSKNQDIDHIRHMYDYLAPKGRLVTIASVHWHFAKGRKELDFKNWLNRLDSEIIAVERSAFKTSGTEVETCIVIIDK
ncbi:methyltransferase [Arsenicibacter rosenii]|uniref:Methyltransferase small domain-containing protein n=1 Tax=Arsenicibacter rosenii TaxID=1750698 RepID=A0A1S2VAU2_9BACT|nr:methyltransferase [Arsenicibacter rosenii]OIN55844.1 hypothetical protein BLX24_27705 [Arsenicibacter rosenii]